jgi:HD-GYP domain-containing protein (c-di-GMP phosphodiesterase class II)
MVTDEHVSASDLFPVPLAVMQPGTVAPVDLYILYDQTGHYILYKRARTHLPNEIRERLIEHGVEKLYLRKQDEDSYYEYVEENIHSIIRDDLMPAEKASQLVYESSARVMANTFEDPRSGRNMRRAHRMVEATVLSILKDPEALWHMTSMASHDYYTYTHCVHVSMFLVTASRDLLGITDSDTLQSIGLGGLFHDIGKSEIPESILNKPGKLTAEEFDAVKRHPELGVAIVQRDRRMNRMAMHLVRSHHEHFDGGGYPQGLVGEGISRVCRLSTVIDVYDALTTNRAYARAREPFKALELMTDQMSDQFDMPLLRQFVKFLGPKPMRLALRARWDPDVASVLAQQGAGQPAAETAAS